MARILIIEDDAEVRDLLDRVIRREGHDVVSAQNGREGISIFRKQAIDLVITDIIMPDKDGIETFLDLRRENPNLKVIAISGGGCSKSDNYLNSAKLLGVDKALKKPFSPEEFLHEVNELLG